jgi:hypothetical protein
VLTDACTQAYRLGMLAHETTKRLLLLQRKQRAAG